MSIDLEWSKLDPSLSAYLVEVLNKQLTNAERPSFIGPVEVTSLDFGDVPPDVELVDLRDIYRDFLEDDEEDSDRDPVKVTEGAEDVEGFEWVSRRAAKRLERLSYQQMRYGREGGANMFSSTPSLHTSGDIWSAGMSSPSLSNYRQPYEPWPNTPLYRSPSPTTPFSTLPLHLSTSVTLESPLNIPPASPHEANADPWHDQPEQQQQTPHPNLQLHLHVNWHSNLRLTLTTSLLINYPSPMFMSLPIKVSITGLIFNGELAVAYEGERRRVHICILDHLDPYGPAGDRPKRDSTNSTPSELDEESPTLGAPTRRTKPLPVGQRLLPSIYIESEIGQTDKHVLKNVTRVERFIQDVIRKTVEEELVFPNFHTLVLANS